MKLTEVDLQVIQKELDRLRCELGPELREKLAEARAQGDLSENFEYTMAKRANNQNLGRIRYLQKLVDTAEIIKDIYPHDVVWQNRLVTVQFPDDDETEDYKIVSSIRSDSLENRISLESPIGKALFRHKAGETVTVKLDDGSSYELAIKNVQYVEDDGTDPLRQY